MKASHVNTLLEAIQVWAEEETDVVIISREGRKVPAHRLILSLFSSKLKNLIKSSPLYIHSTLYLPESSYESISNVLRSVYSGVAQDLDSLDQQEFEETFELLGFDKPISNESPSSVIAIDACNGDQTSRGIKRKKPNLAMREKVTYGNKDVSEEEASVGESATPILNGCLCRSYNPFLPSVSCKNKSCKVKKFHLVCVNLKTVPKGDWFCEACSTNAASVHKCQVCPYKASAQNTNGLMLHYANQHFKSSLIELIDVFFKGNRCFHCDKEVYHNGDSQKIIHIGISHGKIRTILNNYGIELQHKMPKSKHQTGSSKSAQTEKLLSDYSLPNLECELCNTKFTSTKDLRSHQAVFHFKTEITKLLKNYFLYQENKCRRCGDNKAIPSAINKIIHVGTVHGVVEELIGKNDPLIILNEDVVQEDIIEIKVEIVEEEM
eukprot:GFUD01023290.1.p1 GENE.GFUD01023290.1~~GFUD01023290.1.p1  ORF type:complete len:436 (-),score=92.86 GFUD01023290.1:37-1344(-)